MIGPLIIALLAAAPLGSPIGPTVRHRLGPVSFELPVTWRQSSRVGTVQFDSASGESYLLADVGVVQRPDLTPEACLDVVLQRLAAGPSWTKKKIGGVVLAYESGFERSADLSTQARVDRFVGCDGHFTWSLVFFSEATEYTYYGYVVSHVETTLESTGLQPGSAEARLVEDKARESSSLTAP